ncbi:serpin B [Fistulifera solaris]|uniref:Serpin B n=1 Tax=Fistulifera solaris TaxID=1519565 RepID=A0A1Z5KGY7_FISSO|nr:serpin B [Fistulifera solaris]|eukprot:GAX25365.1 serpin B [Fistulifera solaris]
MKFDRSILILSIFTNHYARGSVAEQLITFSDNLSAEMYSEETNDCTSSLGISMAFDLLYTSAIGESKTEMESVFGFSEPKLHWAGNEVSTLYQGACYDGESCEFQDPVVSIANRIYANNNVALNSTYQAVVQDFVQPIDFSDPTAADTINAWVSNSTNGLIDSVVQEVNPGWIILAVNSIYLKAAWRLPFVAFQTTLDSFAGTDAHFMHKVEFLPYSDTAVTNYQIVKMEFFGGSETTQGLSMVFAASLVEGELPSLSAAELVTAMPQLSITRVALALPKFKFESTYESSLETALQNLNLRAPFVGGLCVREGSCGAFIDFIIQKTVIDVNEEGVEAAAVTAIGVVESLPEPTAPALMQLDRPFQFWILHNELPIFEGRVINPGIPEGSTAEPGLSHAATDFWTSNFMVDTPITVVPQQQGATRDPSTQPATMAPSSDSTGVSDFPSPAVTMTSDFPSFSSSDPETSGPTPTIAVTPAPTSDLTSPSATVPTTEPIEGTTGEPTAPQPASDEPSSVPVNEEGGSFALQQVLNSFIAALGIGIVFIAL